MITKLSNTDRVLASLQRSPGLTAMQIAERLNMSKNSAMSALTALYRAGTVYRSPNDETTWCYYLLKKDR